MGIRFLLPSVAIVPMLAASSALPAHFDQCGCTMLPCLLNAEGCASRASCAPPGQEVFRQVACGQSRHRHWRAQRCSPAGLSSDRNVGLRRRGYQ